MRLAAIEAIRYGAMEGACLGELGEGLTVVLGPNESGKTTLTALTRHVLYGYPDGRSKERAYAPLAGARVARLVFADESGEWVIERVDGKNRGPVTIAARRGGERPELLGQLVSGVSEQSYRVVFGFGLDELSLIEHGDSADIVSRLHAAGFGLAVNPMDARKRLEASAAELYAPRASKPAVNVLAARIRNLKLKIAGLEAVAAEFADDQARLGELAGQLGPLRERRHTLDARLHSLENDEARLKTASEDIDALADQAREADAAIADCERAISMVDVDERVLAAAPELSAVLEDTSGFRQRLEALTIAETTADETERRAGNAALPAGAQDTVENRTAVEGWRDRLAGLRAKAQAAEESARQSEARAESTEGVVAENAPAAQAAGSKLLPIVLSLAATGIGVVFAAFGVLMHQPLASVLGAIVLVTGVVALTVTIVRKPAAAAAEAPLSTEAARLRADALAQRSLAESAAGERAAATAEWRIWLAERSLDAHGDDPAAVRALLEELAERHRLLGEAERYRAAATRERDQAEAWVLRLVDAVLRYDESAAQIPPLSEATALAARAKRDLETARAAADERLQLSRDLETARTERRRIGERLDGARAVAAEVAARREVDAASAVSALHALVERTREELAEVRDSYEVVSREHAALSGKLNNEGRDDAMALARQELEGLRGQAQDAADRHLVAALSVRLLDRARERFERERQPEVVRTAGRVFSAMTDGRYTDVRVPLDGGGISVVTADGTIRPTDELSRGTAEQLYLALRIGLIGSLGATGAALPVLMDDVVVNFDPERREGAVAAVAELAAIRQVLFFTCHPETAALLAASVPGAQLRELGRCELG